MIQQVRKAQASLAEFRKNRQTLKNFTFGDQNNIRFTHSGEQMLTNNLIHRLVKTLIGHFRDSMLPEKEPDHNRLSELDARMFEEFLISGAAIQRVSHELRPGFSKPLDWVDNVSPADFFAYPLRDPRALDIEIIGMTHRWSISEAIGRLMDGTRNNFDFIRSTLLNSAFDRSPGFERVEVIEVWNREITPVYRCHDPNNAEMFFIPENKLHTILTRNKFYRKTGRRLINFKIELRYQWIGYFLTTDGIELKRIEADSHPFAVKFYPLLDGEIHSFVAGLIDQQKFVNRLVNMIDNVMSTSAKGVLLFPQDEIAVGMNWEQVAERWGRFDGVIPYLPRPGSPGPHQVVTNPADCGAYELLNIQMSFFDRISGVSNALRGNSDGGNSAQLFDAQTRNSLAAISDTFAAFRDFLHFRNLKLSPPPSAPSSPNTP